MPAAGSSGVVRDASSSTRCQTLGWLSTSSRVRDGGSFFVDLGEAQELVLTVQFAKLDDDPRGIRPPPRPRAPHVRLWGGTPGDAGGFVVSLERPHRDRLSPMSGGLILGTFDATGSIAADLVVGDAYVQGFSFDPLGTKFTPVQRVGEEEEGPSYDEGATIECPHCQEEIYDESVRCPHCGQYLSQEDAPRRRAPWWIWVGVAACLYVVYRWLTN